MRNLRRPRAGACRQLCDRPGNGLACGAACASMRDHRNKSGEATCVILSWCVALGVVLGAADPAAGADLSDQSDQADRSGRSRRTDRRAGAADRRAHAGGARAAAWWSTTAPAPAARSPPRRSPAAEPDGYTLLFGNTATLANIPAVSKIGRLRSGQEFRRRRQGDGSYQILVVRPDLPVKSVAS